MKIEMKPGFEITEEIQKIASGYDFYSCYIDNYTQMIKAQEDGWQICGDILLKNEDGWCKSTFFHIPMKRKI